MLKKGKIPKHIKPMLAYLVNEPFDQKGWIFETKWDGYRALAEIQDKKILLYSRNQLRFNEKFPSVVKALQSLKVNSAVLDGEIVVLNSAGKSQFQLMQNYKTMQKGKVVYCVFDLLYLNGYDIRDLPLIDRKKLLKKLIESTQKNSLRFSRHVKTKGISLFKQAVKKNEEGIIGKKENSPYVMARSHDWVKIKTHQRQEVVIGGYTLPKGARAKMGALLIGVYEKGKLHFIGKVGGGFSEKTLSDVYKLLKPIEQKKTPFINPIKAASDITWVKPKLVCEVSFAEWTADGKLRQPIFKGMRIDKKPTQIKRERALDDK